MPLFEQYITDIAIAYLPMENINAAREFVSACHAPEQVRGVLKLALYVLEDENRRLSSRPRKCFDPTKHKSINRCRSRLKSETSTWTRLVDRLKWFLKAPASTPIQEVTAPSSPRLNQFLATIDADSASTVSTCRPISPVNHLAPLESFEIGVKTPPMHTKTSHSGTKEPGSVYNLPQSTNFRGWASMPMELRLQILGLLDYKTQHRMIRTCKSFQTPLCDLTGRNKYTASGHVYPWGFSRLPEPNARATKGKYTIHSIFGARSLKFGFRRIEPTSELEIFIQGKGWSVEGDCVTNGPWWNEAAAHDAPSYYNYKDTALSILSLEVGSPSLHGYITTKTLKTSQNSFLTVGDIFLSWKHFLLRGEDLPMEASELRQTCESRFRLAV